MYHEANYPPPIQNNIISIIVKNQANFILKQVTGLLLIGKKEQNMDQWRNMALKVLCGMLA